MPVNFQQIQTQIRQMGAQMPRRLEGLARKAEQAADLLASHADNVEALSWLLERALQTDNGLRCAIPGREALNFTHMPSEKRQPAVLIAADGSQVAPDRHAPVEFGVINVGVIRLAPGAGAPTELVISRLLYQDDLDSNQPPLGEEDVALMRDVSERTVLKELACAETPPVVALTDGPLELYREPRSQALFQRLFQEYLAALREMAARRVLCAGYVDRPRADLLVRLLELAHPEYRAEPGKDRPLRGVSDALLLQEILQPGQRSAVFGIQSRSASSFTGEIALHFFYLNLGRQGNPAFARIEISAWLAHDSAHLDLLHSAVAGQAAQMGAKPYPYLLHRAHEIALVTYDERKQLEALIQFELARGGVMPRSGSNKQYHKDHSRDRTRYQS